MAQIIWGLKAAIAEKYGTQVEASIQLKMHESRLSHIVRGYALPSDSEREILEKIFGCKFIKKTLRVGELATDSEGTKPAA